MSTRWRSPSPRAARSRSPAQLLSGALQISAVDFSLAPRIHQDLALQMFDLLVALEVDLDDSVDICAPGVVLSAARTKRRDSIDPTQPDAAAQRRAIDTCTTMLYAYSLVWHGHEHSGHLTLIALQDDSGQWWNTRGKAITSPDADIAAALDEMRALQIVFPTSIVVR